MTSKFKDELGGTKDGQSSVPGDFKDETEFGQWWDRVGKSLARQTPYDKDSVESSRRVALYAYIEGFEHAADLLSKAGRRAW